jgi:hypothetical protein
LDDAVGHHEPPTGQFLVHAGDDPIDLPGDAVFHLRQSVSKSTPGHSMQENLLFTPYEAVAYILAVNPCRRGDRWMKARSSERKS